MRKAILTSTLAILIPIFTSGVQARPIIANLIQIKLCHALIGTWQGVIVNETTIPDTVSDPLNNQSPDIGNPQEVKRLASDKSKKPTPLTSFEFYLSITILFFGIIIISLEIFLIRTGKIAPEDTIKFITITLIIISTLYLITAGYSNDQIAPAVGLLGTIAGYLLGKMNAPNNGERNERIS